MTATVVVAAALGLARLGVQDELDEQPSFSDLLPVLIGAAICATASALCIPVVMISAFSVRRLAARLIAIVLCTLLAAAVFTTATRLESQAPPWIEVFLVMLALFAGAISVLYATLRLLRRQGFVLVRPGRSPPAADDITAPRR